MKTTKIFYFIIFFLVITPIFSYAQSEDESLEGNLEYCSYKTQLDSLQKVQQEILLEINKYKELSEIEIEKKEEYVTLVLKMEGQLFDLRSRIGIISSKCSAIEQEFIIKNMGKKRPVGDPVASTQKQTNSVYILQNKFFTDNVAPDEMRQMRGVENLDSVIFALRDSVRKEGQILSSVNEKLRRTQRAEVADSLYNIAEVALDAVERYEAKLKGDWSEVFDTKIYVYTRLLDKLNVSVSVLSKLSERAREVRSAKDDAMQDKLSALFYAYPMEQELVLNYEKILAEKLVYLSSIDSLNKKLEIIKTKSLDEPAVELPEWDYVTFGSATIGGGGVHSVKNPVVPVKVPTLGSVYMLRISTLTNPLSAYSALKNINPASVFRNELGKYEYYAGVYATKEEAMSDVPKLKRIGFTPMVVEWKEGGKVVDEKTIIPLNVFDNTYRVEFDSVTPEITAKLKELAPGKELLRIDDKYSIGFFKNYLDAVKIQKAIGVECKIVPLETK